MPNKAVAAGGTTALAGAITTILLSVFNHPVSPELAGAITTVVSTLLTVVATYLVPSEVKA